MLQFGDLEVWKHQVSHHAPFVVEGAGYKIVDTFEAKTATAFHQCMIQFSLRQESQNFPALLTHTR